MCPQFATDCISTKDRRQCQLIDLTFNTNRKAVAHACMAVMYKSLVYCWCSPTNVWRQLRIFLCHTQTDTELLMISRHWNSFPDAHFTTDMQKTISGSSSKDKMTLIQNSHLLSSLTCSQQCHTIWFDLLCTPAVCELASRLQGKCLCAGTCNDISSPLPVKMDR